MAPTDHPGCIPTRSIEIQPFVVSTATYGPFSQWPLTLWSWFWAKMACISPLLIVPCEATHSKKNFEHYLALLTRPNKDKDKKKEKDKDKKWFYALLGMNIFQGWIFSRSEYFSGVIIFQGWLFFRIDYFLGVIIFQGWIFFRGDYFSGVNIFLGWIFSGVD